MKNLFLCDDDSPRSNVNGDGETFRSNIFLFSRSLIWMDMDLHLDVSNQTLKQS
ncbi:hypothetical protein Bca101_019758 [Brassica carinata]